ncbi:MAG: Gfo/Idh/MocA family oxidoreductase [Deltaproteobacteria bacterium]|jgi:predicted dehydrogenase|nr:Gfo/Idh/MocA family oxidoreductase [Pseudomonadota bacterium]MCK4603776.1 Gfo/Idh/MocA family oxidoreductase [Deltaproteobacteria bacterium]
MKKMSVAIVGTGGFADYHLSRWLKVEGVKVEAVIGRDQQKTAGLAEKYGIGKFYTDFSAFQKEILHVDILDVVTVPSTHIDIALKLMGSFSGVLIEKPLDVDLEKALSFFNTVKEKKVAVGVVSQMKFGKAYHFLKGLIGGGELGEMINFTIQLSNMRKADYYSVNDGWRDNIDMSGGGIMTSQVIHRLNFVMGIVGYTVEEVFAFKGLSRYARNVEESVSAIFSLKGRFTGLLHATSLSSVVSDYLLFEGTHGIALSDFRSCRICKGGKRFSPDTVMSEFPEGNISHGETFEDHLLNQMTEFAENVRNGGGFLLNLREAINDMIIIQSLYESMARKCSVKIENMIYE